MKRKKLILFLNIIIIITIFTSISYLIKININYKNITTNSDIEKIKPNTILEFNTLYTKCNHTITKKELANNYINLSIDEFKKLYSDWKIISYENNKIVLYKEINDFCNEHYLLQSDNSNNIYLYKLDLNNNIINKTETNININYLTNCDIKNIHNGIYIYR